MQREPVGVDDYKEFVDNDLYFVDKTLFIKDIIDDSSKVVLITRPRRFGKTLNMSLLKYYFEKNDQDNSYLFKEYNIWKSGKKYREEFSKYPVINITLKNAKYDTWEDNYENLKIIISSEFIKHSYLLKSEVLEMSDRTRFIKICDGEASKSEFGNSLELLSKALSAYYKQKVIILIDEYDTLLNEAYIHNFYDKAIGFVKAFLNAGLKSNVHLHKGVMMGIFRVAKESIFSDLNNLNVNTILSNDYKEYFGFTQDEVIEVLKYFNLVENIEKVTRWYNGYIFGETEYSLIYNPWSIIMFINKKVIEPYWINTSGNEIVKKLILAGDKNIKENIKKIIKNEELEDVQIDETIVYSMIETSEKSLWSFLLFAGYLKAVKTSAMEEKGTVCTLKASNKEVLYLFRTIIQDWMAQTISGGNVKQLLDALLTGDVETFYELLYRTVFQIASYNDVGVNNSENFYHAFVLGLLVQLEDDYEVTSNRAGHSASLHCSPCNLESGIGRYGVMLIPKDIKKNGVIIEFKSAKLSKNESIDTMLNQALKQIGDNKYDTELKKRGIENIIRWGIAFKGKEVKVGIVE